MAETTCRRSGARLSRRSLTRWRLSYNRASALFDRKIGQARPFHLRSLQQNNDGSVKDHPGQRENGRLSYLTRDEFGPESSRLVAFVLATSTRVKQLLRLDLHSKWRRILQGDPWQSCNFRAKVV